MSLCEATTSVQANANLMQLDFWLRPAKFHFKQSDNPHDRLVAQPGLWDPGAGHRHTIEVTFNVQNVLMGQPVPLNPSPSLTHFACLPMKEKLTKRVVRAEVKLSLIRPQMTLHLSILFSFFSLQKAFLWGLPGPIVSTMAAQGGTASI